MAAPVFVIFAVLLLMLGGGVWVGLGLMSAGIVGLEVFKTMPVEKLLAQDAWGSMTSPELIALPLFIFMGELLFHTRLSEMTFAGLTPWTQRLPGRLLHVNVLGCTMFAAASGSSAATAATIGRITLTELFSRGYDRSLAMGSLAGAGTLGLLIPPSIILIVYGVLAKVSILQLFIAGIVPGLILAGGFMAYIAVAAIIKPSVVPREDVRYTWGDRLRGLWQLTPMIFLMVLVVGSMYGGYAGPTEAAAIGVLGAVIIAALQRALSFQTVRAAALGTVRTCSMIALLLASALFLSRAMAFLGVPGAVAEGIASLEMGRYGVIFVILAFYLVLGTVMDGLSSIVMTIAITLPLVTAAGFDPIWFGVFLVVVVEMAETSPPVGFNLFIVQQLAKASMWEVSKAVFPFFMIMVALVIAMIFFPEIVTFLSGRAGPQI
jgi:C4-dicarboxylate transporter DctM subunit